MAKIISKETSSLICDLYKNGEKIKEIAKLLNVNRATVENHLHKNNVIVLNCLDKTKNENFFEKIDSEYKAYFLGYIVADGSLLKNSNKIQFTINSQDDYILEFFKNIINSSNIVRRYEIYDKRTNKTYNSSVFGITSKKMRDDLSDKGINSDKTTNFIWPKNIPDNLIHHFLRGMFDGDGHISKTRVRISLISTIQFLNILNNKFFNTKNHKIYDVKKDKNVYKINIQKSYDVLTFLDYIYKDATVFLKRKYDLYLNIKNNTINNLGYKNFSKKVIVLENNEEIMSFNSVKECAKHFNISSCYMTTIIKKDKSLKNYKFKIGELHYVFKKLIDKEEFSFLKNV
jgi:hypothetical protein